MQQRKTTLKDCDVNVGKFRHVGWCAIREKGRLELEKLQKDLEVKTRTTELANMQQELDVMLSAVRKLESQKSDARKRLDELDDKVWTSCNVLFSH